ncbi:sporulation protein [Limibacter armeniacum]|uniref:sporulation protein n=1 Tax=Limibacter armeniacum TaxID=466084 RepID=UPI002FE570AD
MSFFKKMMAGMGVGNMKIDTQLDVNEIQAGESLTGVIHIVGGGADQELNGINMHLMTELHTEDGEHHVITLENYRIVDNAFVGAGEHLQVDFSIPIPTDTPVSFGLSNTWLRTEADVSFAIDPKDDDEIIIAPHPLQAIVMEGIESIGLSLSQVEFEEAPYRMGSRVPVIQELEYRPQRFSLLSKKLDELEVVFVPMEQAMRVFFQIDKRKGWFKEAFDQDESNIYIELPYDQQIAPAQVTQFLEQHIL